MSLADPKTKKDSFFDNIKNVGKRMTFADKAFMFLTAANYAMNPRGAKGIRDVIQHNQDESRKLATANARAALSRVNSSVLPAIRENETWMKDTANYITNELAGVKPEFISALIKANKLDEFKAMTKKINDARALKGQPKLTKQDYELMMPSFRTQISAYTNIDGFENTPESVSKALRKYYAGYDKLLKNAKTPNQLNAGIFASSYGSPLAGMQLANDYLRGAGQTQIGDETVTYDRLSELPIGSIGFDQDQLVAVPGGLDYSKGVPSELGKKIQKQLESSLENTTETISPNSYPSLVNESTNESSFSNMFDPQDMQFDRIWTGDIEEIQKSISALKTRIRLMKESNPPANSTDIAQTEVKLQNHKEMLKIAKSGRGVYRFLHREAYMEAHDMKLEYGETFEREDNPVDILANNMKEIDVKAKNQPKEAGLDRELRSGLSQLGREVFNQNYVFADRHSLKLFIDLMGGIDGGVLSSGTVLRYKTYDTRRVDTVTVEQVLRNESFMADAVWDMGDL